MRSTRCVANATASVGQQLDVVRQHKPAHLDQLKSVPMATQPHLSSLINTWCPVEKIFVAVHGIGDQFQSETVQSVAYRVCDYVGVPAALPLGRFHGPGGTRYQGVHSRPRPRSPNPLRLRGDLLGQRPRIPAADKHILEEPKKWAQTLVERLRLRDAGAMASASGVPPSGR